MGFSKADGRQRDKGHEEPVHQRPALDGRIAESPDEEPENQEEAGKEDLSIRRIDSGQQAGEILGRGGHGALSGMLRRRGKGDFNGEW